MKPYKLIKKRQNLKVLITFLINTGRDFVVNRVEQGLVSFKFFSFFDISDKQF